MAAINFPSNPTIGQTFVHTVSDGGFQDHDIVYKWDGTSWIAYNDGTHNRILSQSSTINVHSDVDTSTISPQASDVLTWTANSTWEPQLAPQGYADSDVDTHLNQSSASSGDVLSWNGTDYAWVANQTISTIGSLSNVDSDADTYIGNPSLTAGAVLHWVDQTDQYEPRRVDLASGFIQNKVINSLGDVDTLTISPQASDVLTWTANNTWEPQEASGSTVPNSAIAETGIEVQIDVRVVTKTTDHRYHGQGSSLGYMFKIDGIDYESPFLDLVPGKTYKFDQSEPSNANHELLFYEDAAKTIPYTTAVVSNGSAGQAGDFTSIAVTTSTPAILYYQCVNHAYMGNQLQTKGIASGGSGSPTSAVRQTVAWQNTVASNADVTTELSLNTTFTNVDSYAIMEVEADTECWIRLYTSSTARNDDSSRDIDTDPTPGSGLLLETVHLEDQAMPGNPPAPIKITPGVYGWNEDVSGSDRSKLHMTIKNLTTSSANIYVTIKFLPLEYS